MRDIHLDEKEMALWNEVGARGDAFRRATLDRAAEESRLDQQMIEVREGATDAVLATQGSGEPDPEASEVPAPAPATQQ